ncbi:MAG TPA: glutamate-cysteine ligase family protein [Gemmatimonadaceae bacterium]
MLEDVRQRLFAASPSDAPRAIGLELELIPLVAVTHKPALAARGAAHSTSDVLSRIAVSEGWTEQPAGDDPSAWTLPDGARISFEPGGQIEISTAPQPTSSGVITATQTLVSQLRSAMAADGIELLARGVDPYNDITAVPLQLHRERYSRMTRYFEAIGPSGVRMMRQTAALQMNLEHGDDPLFRWRLLNALAPIVVALFASSREYAGKATGWASYRAQLWRTLDPTRTGLPYDEADPAAHYLDFALDAGAMRAPEGSPRTFRQWLTDDAIGQEEWTFHLSTLFPEVRPKEFFELRSADSVEPDFLAAPVVFVTSLVYDDKSARDADELLGPPRTGLLERAGRDGLDDSGIRSLASDLTELALRGAKRLGDEYISEEHREDAARYFAHALAANDI